MLSIRKDRCISRLTILWHKFLGWRIIIFIIRGNNKAILSLRTYESNGK